MPSRSLFLQPHCFKLLQHSFIGNSGVVRALSEAGRVRSRVFPVLSRVLRVRFWEYARRPVPGM
jgi:hypothetical protein